MNEYHTLKDECRADITGKNYYRNSKDVICMHGCGSDSKCIKIHEDEGKECIETTELKCTDDRASVLICTYNDNYDYDNNEPEYVYAAERCPDAYKCVMFGNHPACTETCTKESENTYTCLDENSSYIRECTATSDGKAYYWDTKEVSCMHECGSDGKCIKYHEDEGKECSIKTTESKCSDDKTAILFCTYNDNYYYVENEPEYVYTAEKCTDTDKCVMIDDEPKCTQTCTKGSENTYTCLDENSSYIRECTASSDGKAYYWDTKEVSCMHECGSDGKCIKYHEDEGKECSYDTFEAKCADDKTILYCETNFDYNPYDPNNDKEYIYIAEKCFGQSKCIMNDYYPACVEYCSAEEAGDIKYQCENTKSVIKQCKESYEKYEWYDLDKIICKNGCDITTGKCKPSFEGEYDSCTKDFKAYCKDGIAVNCETAGDIGTVIGSNCKTDEVCAMETYGDELHAICAEKCSKAEIIDAECYDEYSSVLECTKDLYISFKDIYCEYGCDDKTGLCKSGND